MGFNKRKAPRQTPEDIAREKRNRARLDEVNDFLKGIDLTLWQVDSATGVDGYILGVYMTLKPTGEAIMAESAEDIASAERMYHMTTEHARLMAEVKTAQEGQGK